MNRQEAENKAREWAEKNSTVGVTLYTAEGKEIEVPSDFPTIINAFLACYDWMMGGEPDGYIYDLENPATAKEDHRLINVWPTKYEGFTKPVKLFEMPLPPPPKEEE